MKDFRTVTLADQVFERLESDIIQGVYPRGEVLTELKLVEQLNVSRTPILEAAQRLADGPRILGHPLHQGITFGMHGCIVQRILTSRNAQETGALLKGFRPHAFHFHQIPPSGEGAVFRTVVHDILCQLRP